MMTLILRTARYDDVKTILEWRAEAAAWLHERYGVDQWQVPFPAKEIAATVTAGQVWMLDEQNESIATITVTKTDSPLVWTLDELTEPAHYIHKLTVRPAHAGRQLGSALLDWASQRAEHDGAKWLRLDAWTTNPGLHRYYEQQGFRHIRTVANDPRVVSGALFERPAGVIHGTGPAIKEEKY